MKKNLTLKDLSKDIIRAPMETIEHRQITDLGKPSDYPPPEIYCPVCGAPIMTVKKRGSCSHLIFAHDYRTDSFSYMDPEYLDLVRLILEYEMDNNFNEFLYYIEKSSILVLRISYGGNTHYGEVWTKKTVAFDFCPEWPIGS